MDHFKRPLAGPEICRGFSRRACVMSQIFALWYIQTKGSWLYTYIYIYTYLLNLIPIYFFWGENKKSIYFPKVYIYIYIYIYTTYLWEVPKKNLNRRPTHPVAFPRQGTCPLRPAVGNATSWWRWRWETAGGYVGSFENGHRKSLDILKSFKHVGNTLNIFKKTWNYWLILIVGFYRKNVA